MRCSILLLLLLLAGISLANSQVQTSQEHSYRITRLAEGLEHPWSLVSLPKGHFLVAERGGTVHFLDQQGHMISSFRLDGVSSIGQGGLMDLTLHPEFMHNHWVYYTSTVKHKSGYGTALGRFEFTNGLLGKQEELFIADNIGFGSRHFGSRIVFDDKGYLYLCLGDRGDREEAQDLTNHKGTILRLGHDASIPQDNPFSDIPNAKREIYSYGHRNIQGCVFAEARLWAHEHGPRGGDELNIIHRGANYGWPIITHGRAYSGLKIGEGTHKEGMKQPVVYWVPSIAPSGMLFYTKDKFPRWQGNFFIGALAGRHLLRLVIKDGSVTAQEQLLRDYGRIREVMQDEQGYIYVLTDHANGELLRIEPLDTH